MKFTEWSFGPEIQKGLDDAGFVECTPVQDRSFEQIFNERDLMVQSQTGTGKTAAFLLSYFHLRTSSERFRGTHALVVAPTRELVVQIEDEAKALGAHLGLRIGTIFGGVAYGPQEKLLKDGFDLLIGTPGRLLDFMGKGMLKTDGIGMMVLDEADRMFDMGFYSDTREIMSYLPGKDKRLTMLFSATLSTKVRELAWEFMNEPVAIEIEPEHITVDAIKQSLYHVNRQEKFPLMLGIMQKRPDDSVIIFTNTKRAAEEISRRLGENQIEAEFIMGDLPQKKRIGIIKRMKERQLRVLVATDVAARGLHINDLDLVINYDVPEDPENYVHRIGRTARAGKTGTAITMACDRYIYGLSAIEKLIDRTIEVAPVDPSEFGVDKSKPFAPRNDQRPRSGNRDGRTRGPGQRSDRSPSQGSGNRNSRRSEQRPRPAQGSDRRATDDALPRKSGEQKPRSRPKAAQGKGPSRKSEDRLAYYEAKYGESFEVKGQGKGPQAPKNPSSKKKKPHGSKTSAQGSKNKPAPQSNQGNGASPAKPTQAPKQKKGIAGFLSRLFKKKD